MRQPKSSKTRPIPRRKTCRMWVATPEDYHQEKERARRREENYRLCVGGTESVWLIQERSRRRARCDPIPLTPRKPVLGWQQGGSFVTRNNPIGHDHSLDHQPREISQKSSNRPIQERDPIIASTQASTPVAGDEEHKWQKRYHTNEHEHHGDVATNHNR